MQNKPNVKNAQINVNSYMKSKYEILDTWLSGKNKPNLVRPALFAKELPDWSNPIRQACVVCEAVAGLIKANFRRNVRSNEYKLLCCRVLVPLNYHIDIIYQRFFASYLVIILNL